MLQGLCRKELQRFGANIAIASSQELHRHTPCIECVLEGLEPTSGLLALVCRARMAVESGDGEFDRVHCCTRMIDRLVEMVVAVAAKH